MHLLRLEKKPSTFFFLNFEPIFRGKKMICKLTCNRFTSLKGNSVAIDSRSRKLFQITFISSLSSLGHVIYQDKSKTICLVSRDFHCGNFFF